MILSIIVAVGENNEIGKANGMLWHLPLELKRFKELTTGHAIIMGRKTFESLPKGALPNRRNVVLTRNHERLFSGCETYSGIDVALLQLLGEKEIFVIGGAEIYKQALPIVDKMYLTRVHAKFEDADTFFPEIHPDYWEILREEYFPADEKNPYAFTFYEYERI